MSLAGFTFGSFGDVITLISIVLQVRRALGDSAGASEDHQALIAELDSFSHLLHAVREALTIHDGPRKLPNSVRHAMDQGLFSSAALLADFYKDVERYSGSLRQGGSGSVVRDSWMKVEWALCKKEDVRQMRRKLADQVGRINALLSVSYWHALDCVEDVCHQHRIALVEVSRRMEELPKALGYPWAVQRPIQLRHILGHTIDLPMDLFTTSEFFDDFLKFFFKDRPGSRFVGRGDYDLSTSPGDASASVIIAVEEWKAIVKPGVAIDMNAVLRRRIYDSEHRHRVCTSCDRALNTSSVTDSFVIQCTFCQTWLTVSNGPIENNAGGQARSSDIARKPSSQRSLDEPPGSQEDTDQDLKFIRRVRLLELHLYSPSQEPHAQSVPDQLDVDRSLAAEDSPPISDDGEITVQLKEASTVPEVNMSDCTTEPTQSAALTPEGKTLDPASLPSRIIRQKSSITFDTLPSPTRPPDGNDRRSPSPTSIFSARSGRSIRWARRTSFVENTGGHFSHRFGLPARVRRRSSNATLASSLPSTEQDNWISDDEDLEDSQSPVGALALIRPGFTSSLFSPTRTCVGSSTDVGNSRPTSRISFLKKYSPFRRSSHSLVSIDDARDRTSGLGGEEIDVANIDDEDGEIVRKRSRMAKLLSFVKRCRTTSTRV